MHIYRRVSVLTSHTKNKPNGSKLIDDNEKAHSRD